MKRLLLVLVFSVVTLPVLASHIVGGEIELLHISGNTYRLNLIYYLDYTNNPTRRPDLEEPDIELGIFRKSNHSQIRTVSIPFIRWTDVNYTQLECSDRGIATKKVFYSGLITLNPSTFGDQGGYYISWERCCRNYNGVGLLNIVSEQPPDGVSNFPRAAGQTFYLEFPAVVRDGQPFINSSPQLFPPLSDYGCINKPYYTDFAGTDADGDSLAYSLATPLSTIESLPVPENLHPGPYPQVQWMPTYNLDNMMHGAPDLAISSEGLLTVTPTLQGLFVFGVLCEEFRNGVKIGELRRDFQMYVLDCPRAVPPVILGKKITDTDFIYKDNMSLSFDRTVTDENRCFDVQVSDKDIHNATDGFIERIKIRAIAMGFKGNVNSILPSVTTAILNQTDSVKTFRICFDECPFVERPFRVGILAFDDACALPLLDTMRVAVTIEPPVNNNARFITPDITSLMDEGDPIKRWPIQAVDDDGDPMIMSILTVNGFVPGDVGMNFTTSPQVGQSIKGEFSWDPSCNLYDFSTKTEFEVKLLVEDQDFCGFHHPDTLTLDLKINLPSNFNPVIDTDLTPEFSERRINDITRKVNESLTFNVTGDDPDNDLIILGVRGLGFNLANYSITFPGATGDGNVASQFAWNIKCDNVNLGSKDLFEFEFIVVDNSNRCHVYQADTVNVKVKVEPPDNEPPLLSMLSLLPDVALTNNEASITLGQQISIKLTGTDADITPQKDNLKLELVEATGNVAPFGYVFDNAEGPGPLESVFSWLPECEIFEGGIYENDYVFKFRVTDNKCFNGKEEFTELRIKIKDIEAGNGEFIPNNYITPNGDGCNDYFAMDGMDDAANTCGEANLPNLPNDNCAGRFLAIRIYNRWGKQIYSSANRNFRWYAEGEATGVYFYYMTYTGKEYKGTINVQ